MSDIALKRAYVNEMYSGPGWKSKVRQMSDAQIVAIYLREQTKAADKKAADAKEKLNGDDIPF
jgi:hypothetical protein